MRTSQYAVHSAHRFVDGSGDRVRVIMNTATGRVFTLPDDVAEALTSDPAVLSPSALAELQGVGLITEATSEFPAVVAAQRAAGQHQTRSFVLMPTAACNFDCGYCGQENCRQSWTDADTDSTIARIETAAASGRYAAVSIGWFGGEPLMGYRRMQEVSHAAIDSCDRHGLEYHAKIVTNGSLLDARRLRQLCTDMRVTSIEVTIDGPGGEHDLLRPTKSGRESFTRIVAALRLLTQDPDVASMHAIVRTNISRINRHSALRFAREMADAGLAHQSVTFYPSPVRSWGNDVSGVALDATEAVATEIEWLTAYQRFGLHCGLIPARAPAPVCIAVDPTAEVVAPDGSLYACTEQPLVPGRSRDALGHVSADATQRPASIDDHWTPTSRSSCASCSIYPLCGGRCPLAWREGSVPCPVLRDSLPRRLDLYATATGLIPETVG